MEIIFELECGLDVEFTPDWGVSTNHSDHSQVQWKLSDSTDTECLDDVLIVFQKEQPVSGSRNYLEACDCYTDVIREKMTPEELEGPEPFTRINLKEVLVQRCNPKIIPIDPT